MSVLDDALRDLVLANRILADHDVLDAFGHISIRHPERPDRYFVSRSRGPNLIVRDDLLEFDLDSNPIAPDGRAMYAERAIHGEIYKQRPDVNAVCHNHSAATIPFGVSKIELRPILHMGSIMGRHVPVWDIADEFGDTNMLVTTAPAGASLAKALGDGRVALMRGHGSVVATGRLRETVFTCIYMQKNAEMAARAQSFGEVRYLSDREIQLAMQLLSEPLSQDRAWDSWTGRLFPEEYRLER